MCQTGCSDESAAFNGKSQWRGEGLGPRALNSRYLCFAQVSVCPRRMRFFCVGLHAPIGVGVGDEVSLGLRPPVACFLGKKKGCQVIVERISTRFPPCGGQRGECRRQTRPRNEIVISQTNSFTGIALSPHPSPLPEGEREYKEPAAPMTKAPSANRSRGARGSAVVVVYCVRSQIAISYVPLALWGPG